MAIDKAAPAVTYDSVFFFAVKRDKQSGSILTFAVKRDTFFTVAVLQDK